MGHRKLRPQSKSPKINICLNIERKSINLSEAKLIHTH